MRPYPFVHCRDSERRFFAFDMFGTLVCNTKGTVLPIFETLCTYYPGVNPTTVADTYHTMTREFKESHDNMELPIDRIVRHLDSVFGFDNDPASMETPLLRETQLYAPAKGVERTLKYLKDNGYRIGVLSNTRYHSCTLRGLLEDGGISEYIDTVIASADIGYRKSHPESYRRIAESLGAEVSECFYCGDNVSKDYYGALSAGMKGSVLISTEPPKEVHYSVASIGDVPELFH